MKFESFKFEAKEQEENELEDIAQSVGLQADIPKAGSPAYRRLEDACIQYTEAVVNAKYTHTSPNLSSNEMAKERSEKRRRSIHNQLCVMLVGTTWNETPSETRIRISDFAVTVGKREDYVGTF